jgi:ferrous iron transport protein B
VATGKTICKPHRIQSEPPEIKRSVAVLIEQIKTLYPDLPNARWVALRLLDGDERIAQALVKGELGDLNLHGTERPVGASLKLEEAR